VTTTYERTQPDTRPASPAAPWLAAGGVALLACALVAGSAQSTGDFRWWAAFVLVPGALIGAAGALLWARSRWRSAGGYVLTCVGVHVYAVGTLLAFGAMRSLWALTIILPSLAVAGGYAWRPADPIARAFHRTVAMLAVAGVALGVTMLVLDATGRFDALAQWWPWFMIAGGVIVVGNGLELLRYRLAYRVPAAVLATGPGLVAILLGIRFLDGWTGIS
jgi:hypothetical protein